MGSNNISKRASWLVLCGVFLMKVLLWGYGESENTDFMWIVLWDGKHTYWMDDLSKPSGGYECNLKQMQGRGYFYVGEL